MTKRNGQFPRQFLVLNIQKRVAKKKIFDPVNLVPNTVIQIIQKDFPSASQSLQSEKLHNI